MENLQLIISICGGVLGIIVTALGLIIPFVRNAKAKTALENVLKIGNAVTPYIAEAEKFVNYTGEEKKAYVMTKATQYAIDNGIKVDMTDVSGKIEELVKLTKEVNAKIKENELL